MNISPLFLAIRAISAEFAHRLFLPVASISGGVYILLLGVTIWLVTLSGWWWFLLAPLILLGILCSAIFLVAWFSIKLLRPQQTKQQRQEVRAFVDALQFSAETAQTPKFILLFRLVKDLVTPSKQSFINELSGNATTLQKGLKTIVASFQTSSR